MAIRENHGGREPVQLPLTLPSLGGLSLPHQLIPMNGQVAAEAFDSPDYLFEVRWDGIRTIAFAEQGQLRLRNPHLGEIGPQFPELRQLLEAVNEQPAIIDGEVVMVDQQGRPDFDALQRRLRLVDEAAIQTAASQRPACYLAFDLLFHATRWVTDQPLERRKALLHESVRPMSCVYLSEDFESDGRSLFEAAIESELEGITAKMKQSPYIPGARTSQWLTIRGSQREDVIICGCCLGGMFEDQASLQLLLGCYDAGEKLRFVGMSSAPEGEAERTELLAFLNAIQIDHSPFDGLSPRADCSWFRPEVVATVRHGEWGAGNRLRFARFERVRADLPPEHCRIPSPDLPHQLAGEDLADEKPRLTLLMTLPLPLPVENHDASRPSLRIVKDGGKE